ncbi:hypothetical protein SY88_10780 [Clostridiales bacterium PH28_bin88]|nr:hypothetical protein SY88_10780 [Clostridiales bacterium PH28_bin88]
MRYKVLLVIAVLSLALGGLWRTSREVDRMLGPAETGAFGVQITSTGFHLELLGEEYLFGNNDPGHWTTRSLAFGKKAWRELLQEVLPWGREVAVKVRELWYDAAGTAEDYWAGLKP